MNNFKPIKSILSEVRNDRKSHFKQTSGFVQHGNTSVMKHCISVAYGFKHPYFAFRNADRDFKLNDIEKNVILRHMFPLTPIPPACREAWIVCMADKYCSARETMYTVKRYAHNARQLVFG